METDAKQDELWFGPLNQTEAEELKKLGSETSEGHVLVETCGETWAVFPHGVPVQALATLERSVLDQGKTLGPIETLQRREAIVRLKTLEGKGLHPNVAKEFEFENRLNFSDMVPLGKQGVGALFWVSDENYANLIEDIERREGIVVYHATHEHTAIGETLDLFFVSKYPEEWETDREDIESGYSLSYVANLDCDHCSEFGGIGFAVSGGGLVRTA